VQIATCFWVLFGRAGLDALRGAVLFRLAVLPTLIKERLSIPYDHC